MSTIQEILKAQAQAVQANREKIKTAEALETTARFLRQEAAKPAVVSFKAIGKAKKERVERYGLALAKAIKEEAAPAIKRDAAIKAAGWTQLSSDPYGTQVYTMKGKPGLRLVVNDKQFSVTSSDRVIKEPTFLSELEGFLKNKM